MFTWSWLMVDRDWLKVMDKVFEVTCMPRTSILQRLLSRDMIMGPFVFLFVVVKSSSVFDMIQLSEMRDRDKWTKKI